jgi:hypothetical protein
VRTRTPASIAVEFARPYAPVQRTASPFFSPPVTSIAWDPVNRGAMIYMAPNLYAGLDTNGINMTDPRRGNGKESGRKSRAVNLRSILHW